ncbi:MAG: hypothetical protein QXH32_09850 [Candidatus Caldarchaeum sp.]
MKRKTVGKKGRKKAGRRRKVPKKIAKLKLPKPIEERVAKETDNPADVQVLTHGSDPVVYVKGKTVGAWVDL